MTRQEAVLFLINHPVRFAHLLGFTKLTEALHDPWIKSMILGEEDETLQSHRGSYKTTCVSVALAIICILFPNDRSMFMRKTDLDVKEIIKQTQNILKNPYTQVFVMAIYGVNLKLDTESATEIKTNLTTDIKGTAQLVGMGMGASLTGKHFDRIFTDDIVNIQDRISKAERERTKVIYQELQNIKNRGGRIFNTGTPWHIEDAFSIMPKPKVFDCYSTGLISEADLADIKQRMAPSLFCANYELRHIASENVIFSNPVINGDPSMVEQGIAHIDASYGGQDGTAFTIGRKIGEKYYIYGKLYHKHIDDVEDEIIAQRKRFNAGRISCEDNGDKGYLGKSLRSKGERTHIYHEAMNKYIKITSYLKAVWKDVVFVAGTDEEYITQITDYTEDAEHDDAPDSCACVVRELWRKHTPTNNNNSYFL